MIEQGGTKKLSLQSGSEEIGSVRLTDGVDTADVIDQGTYAGVGAVILDGSGNPISSFGGGVQYTEGDTDSSVTGTAVMWEDTGDTMRPVSAAKPLPVNIVAGSSSGTEYTQDDPAPTNPTGPMVMGVRRDSPAGPIGSDGDVLAVSVDQYGRIQTNFASAVEVFTGATPLDVEVTASALPTGAATAANQTTMIGHLDGVEGILTTIDADTGNISTKIDTIAGAVSGTEVQVDVVTMPTVTVQATNLDIRDLSSASDSVAAAQSGAWSVTADTELTTADMNTGAGTDTRAVVGMVLAENGGGTLVGSANPMPISAASLPLPTGAATASNQSIIIGHVDGIEAIANSIKSATETVAGAVSGTEMQVDVLTMPTVTVTATNLDIRDLSSASDSVTVHGDVGVIDQFDLSNSNPAAVAIVDGNGDQITSFGGGVQYTEGDTDASITGTAVMWEDTGNTLRPVSASTPLPIGGSTVPVASASGTGLSVSRTDAQTATVTAVKAGSGRVYGYHVYNPNTSDAYLHFYNIVSGSVTVGSSSRTRTLWIPAGGAIDTVFTVPLEFGTAISIAATTTITGSSAPSTGLLVDIDYI